MTKTYKAILRGDHLKWIGDTPEQVYPQQEVEVYVTILPSGDLSLVTSDGKAMAEALNNLAASDSLSGLSDPLAWQAEQRQDRILPGRDS